jgi:hypothetical protein
LITGIGNLQIYSYATGSEQEDMVKILLATDKIEVNFKLLLAIYKAVVIHIHLTRVAAYEHEDIARLLRTKDIAGISSITHHSKAALQIAAQNGKGFRQPLLLLDITNRHKAMGELL